MRNDPYSRYSALRTLSQDIYDFGKDCKADDTVESIAVKLLIYAQTNGSRPTDRSVLERLAEARPILRRALEARCGDIYRDKLDDETKKLVSSYNDISGYITELTPRFEHMVQFKALLSDVLTTLRQGIRPGTGGKLEEARALNAFEELLSYSLVIQRRLRVNEDEEQRLIELIERVMELTNLASYPDVLRSFETQFDQLRVLHMLEETS